MEYYISEKELRLPASTQMALQSILWKKKASKIGYALERQMYILWAFYTSQNETQSYILCKDFYVCSKVRTFTGIINNQESGFRGGEEDSYWEGLQGPSLSCVTTPQHDTLKQRH